MILWIGSHNTPPLNEHRATGLSDRQLIYIYFHLCAFSSTRIKWRGKLNDLLTLRSNAVGSVASFRFARLEIVGLRTVQRFHSAIDHYPILGRLSKRLVTHYLQKYQLNRMKIMIWCKQKKFQFQWTQQKQYHCGCIIRTSLVWRDSIW